MHSVLIELLTSRMSMHSTHSLNKKIHYTGSYFIETSLFLTMN